MTVDAQAATPANPDTFTDPHLRQQSETVIEDTVESIVPLMPIVLPVVGGVLIFLLAFIAISMA